MEFILSISYYLKKCVLFKWTSRVFGLAEWISSAMPHGFWLKIVKKYIYIVILSVCLQDNNHQYKRKILSNHTVENLFNLGCLYCCIYIIHIYCHTIQKIIFLVLSVNILQLKWSVYGQTSQTKGKRHRYLYLFLFLY